MTKSDSFILHDSHTSEIQVKWVTCHENCDNSVIDMIDCVPKYQNDKWLQIVKDYLLQFHESAEPKL